MLNSELNFGGPGNKIYVIDTSALIILDYTFPKSNPSFTAVWEEVEEMIRYGNFRTIDYVVEEINSYEGKEGFLKKWVHDWKKHLVHPTTEACYNAAIPIISAEYTSGFFDAKKQAAGQEEADPYLIAYCKVFDCTLITAENKTKPNKMPQVAMRNGVACMDVNEFIKERGLVMMRRK